MPGRVTLIPSDNEHFRAVERRAPSGKQIGEITIAMVNAALIMDRDGVLHELVEQAVAEILAPPRQGAVLADHELELPGGHGHRIDVVAAREPIPYTTVIALGHADFMVPAALFIVIRKTQEDWAAADEILDSVRFAE